MPESEYAAKPELPYPGLTDWEMLAAIEGKYSEFPSVGGQLDARRHRSTAVEGRRSGDARGLVSVRGIGAGGVVVAGPSGSIFGVDRPGQVPVQGWAGGWCAAGFGAGVQVGAQVGQRVQPGAFGGGGYGPDPGGEVGGGFRTGAVEVLAAHDRAA